MNNEQNFRKFCPIRPVLPHTPCFAPCALFCSMRPVLPHTP